MTDTLVERLQNEARNAWERCDSVAAETCEQAATRIEALQRSNSEKDEALLDIRNRILCPVGPSPTLDEIAQIARSSETSND